MGDGGGEKSGGGEGEKGGPDFAGRMASTIT